MRLLFGHKSILMTSIGQTGPAEKWVLQNLPSNNGGEWRNKYDAALHLCWNISEVCDTLVCRVPQWDGAPLATAVTGLILYVWLTAILSLLRVPSRDFLQNELLSLKSLFKIYSEEHKPYSFYLFVCYFNNFYIMNNNSHLFLPLLSVNLNYWFIDN